MKLADMFVRPSDVVRSIEDGFAGSAVLIRNVSIGAAHDIRDFTAGFKRGYRVERAARKLADAALVSVELADARSVEEMRDLESIKVRTAQLIQARMSRKVA